MEPKPGWHVWRSWGVSGQRFGGVLVSPGAVLGGVSGGPGAVLGRPGASLGPSWRLLGASWAVLGASWGLLGASWRRLGASWGRLGAVLGRPGSQEPKKECEDQSQIRIRAIFGPLLGPMDPKLAPKMQPKSMTNRSQNRLKKSMPFESDFWSVLVPTLAYFRGKIATQIRTIFCIEFGPHFCSIWDRFWLPKSFPHRSKIVPEMRSNTRSRKA